jgi:hypothetical protein
MHLQVHGHGALQIHPALDSLGRSRAPRLIFCTDFLAVVDIIIVVKILLLRNEGLSRGGGVLGRGDGIMVHLPW